MQKTVLAAVCGLVIFSQSTLAHAQSASPSSSPSGHREELRQGIKDAKAELKTVREEAKTKLQEMRSNVAGLHASSLEKRFALVYSRLKNIATRTQTRLDTLKAAGKDTTPAQTQLTAALATLESAKAKMDEAIAAFRAIDPAKFSEQKDKAFAARDLAVAARKLFQDAHTELKAAIKTMRALSPKPSPSATPTN